jgi:hypothetical protein
MSEQDEEYAEPDQEFDTERGPLDEETLPPWGGAGLVGSDHGSGLGSGDEDVTES